MSDLTTGLIVIVVTAILVAVIFILVAVQKQKRETELRNLSSLNGWNYESIKDHNAAGWRLHKGDWTIEAVNQTSRSGNSTEVTSQTRWFSSTARMTDGIILIGPHQPDINFAGLGEAVKMVAIRMMIGDQAQAAVGIERVELGSLELMARYMVWTNRVEIAKKLLEDPLENALRAMPARLTPLIRYSPAGLEIKLQGLRLYKEQDIYALVKLGNTLLDSAYSVEKTNKPL